MSLLLNGLKTLTIAGTRMTCLEIYTQEAYTFPLQFRDELDDPIDITGWTLSVDADYYTSQTITYITDTQIDVGDLTALVPQPSTGTGTYTDDLEVVVTNAPAGQGYLYVPTTMTGGTGTPDPTPVITLANSPDNTNLVILTITVSRTDETSSEANISRLPIGIIYRYL